MALNKMVSPGSCVGTGLILAVYRKSETLTELYGV